MSDFVSDFDSLAEIIAKAQGFTGIFPDSIDTAIATAIIEAGWRPPVGKDPDLSWLDDILHGIDANEMDTSTIGEHNLSCRFGHRTDGTPGKAECGWWIYGDGGFGAEKLAELKTEIIRRYHS